MAKIRKDHRHRRGKPQINRDHYGVCYVIIADDGEPVSEWIFDDPDKAKDLRNHTPGWEQCRIVLCGYRTFAEEPEIVDDPAERIASSPNTNCLDGLRCPDCEAREPFQISARTIATVHDDGVHETSGHEWDNNAPIRCVTCDGVWRTVAEFSRRVA